MGQEGSGLRGIILVLFMAVSLYAKVIPLNESTNGISSFPDILIYKDTTKKLTMEKLRSLKFQDKNSFRTNYGNTRANLWLKFDVKNTSTAPLEWILRFNYGQFDYLDAWQYDDQGNLIKHVAKGDHRIDTKITPFEKRCTFDFQTSPKQKNTVYVKIAYASSGYMELYHSIWSKKVYENKVSFEKYVVVAIMSALAVLLFYNTFIYFIIRKKEYFWYNLYLVGVICAMLTFNQIGAHYMWNGSIYLIDMMPLISAIIIFITFAQFSRTYLETADNMPLVDKFFRFLILLEIFALILAHLHGRYFAILILQITSFTLIVFPFIGLKLWLGGYKIARGYTIASAVLALTVLVTLLRASGVVETDEFTFWISRIGFIIEGILLSVALADRITILEKEKIFAQEREKSTLEHTQKLLQTEVKKRTQELEVQTKKAQKLARTDEMTGIWNRRAFLEHAQEMLYDANRYKQVFSLALIDIDYFKHVNDRYGHEAGDLVLIEFVKEIKKNIRDTDFFARIGGEEFILLLPHTKGEQAVEKSKGLLEKIAKLEIEYKEETLSITASIGVCEYEEPLDSVYSMLPKADEALYFVKQNGRNNVQLYE